MDDLVSAGKLTSKEYKGKAVYWASQDRYLLVVSCSELFRFGETTDESVKDLDKEIKALQKEEAKLSGLVCFLSKSSDFLCFR